MIALSSRILMLAVISVTSFGCIGPMDRNGHQVRGPFGIEVRNNSDLKLTHVAVQLGKEYVTLGVIGKGSGKSFESFQMSVPDDATVSWANTPGKGESTVSLKGFKPRRDEYIIFTINPVNDTVDVSVEKP